MKLSPICPAPSFLIVDRYARVPLWLVAITAALILSYAPAVYGETWNLGAGGTWNDTNSWNPMSIPNGVGANATFNNAASSSNAVAQTGNRAVTADGPQTVGSINFNNDAVNTFTMSITVGTGGSLTFDE